MAECTEGDPHCSLSASELVAGSLIRILSADSANFVDDILVVSVFFGVCLFSWFLTNFVIGICKRPRSSSHSTGQSQFRNRPPTRRGGYRNQPEVEPNPGDPVDPPVEGPQNQNSVVDYRATGDGWEPEGEFDPDYDVNNEVIMMMIRDDDVLEELSEEGSHDSDDEEVVRRIIMAQTDEEARSYALNAVEDIVIPETESNNAPDENSNAVQPEASETNVAE
uniref:Uncharacterized protein n=1 Tax=Ciona savignyi TaxID=51511 RepID=H2ZC14_CIOSA